MTSKIKMLVATGLLLATFAGPVHAEPHYAVVHDSNGNVVRNSTGNCVLTKWLSDKDTCLGPMMLTQDERTVYFDFNKSTLTKDGKARLNSLIAKIKAAPGPIVSVDVVGFADRIGTPSYNEKLSKKRAQTVHSYLKTHGLKNAKVAKTRWLGDTEPATDCPEGMPRKQLIQCLQPDRRVEVEIVYDP